MVDTAKERGEGEETVREELRGRRERIFDLAHLLAALLFSVDEILICILQLKVFYTPLEVLKT